MGRFCHLLSTGYWMAADQVRAPFSVRIRAVTCSLAMLLEGQIMIFILEHTAGILQMCLKEDDAIGFVATGIMLEIQDDILGLSINELEPRKW